MFQNARTSGGNDAAKREREEAKRRRGERTTRGRGDEQTRRISITISRAEQSEELSGRARITSHPLLGGTSSTTTPPTVMEASTRLALVSPGALRAYSAVLPAAGTALFARHASSLLGPVATATAPSPTHPPLHSALLRQRRRQQQQHQQLSARPFSQSARTPALNPYETAGGNAFGLSSSSSPSSSAAPGGPPVSYFSGRQSLPANTIIRFVPQQTAWIVERMGKFYRILEPGLAILIPFLDRIAYVKSLKETAIEIPSQNAITADNVTLELDGVLYTRVDDAYKA
ncbi:HIR complex subunit, partial [Ascosphaera acerosa]